MWYEKEPEQPTSNFVWKTGYNRRQIDGLEPSPMEIQLTRYEYSEQVFNQRFTTSSPDLKHPPTRTRQHGTA